MTAITINAAPINRKGLERTAFTWLIGATAALALPIAAALAEDKHVMVGPGEVEWAPAPASIPKGAEAAILYGDPSAANLFALRLRLPAGYKLPPHHHPKPEVVTVISGTFRLGMGEEANRDKTRALEAGSFFAFEPGMAHYAFTDEETVIQLNSTGPWGLEYVNAADDPRRASR